VTLLAVGADFSFTWPSASELVAAGVRETYWYCGPAMPPGDVVDSWVAAGLGQVSIFETFSEQAQSDRATGRANATYLRARVASIGYSRVKAAYVMSDGSAYVPSGPLPTISDYSGGVGDIEQQGFIGYGNEDAVAAAMRGSPFCNVDWIPETWTSRQGQGIRQLVGPVPIAGIDLNHRFVSIDGVISGPTTKRGAHGMWIASHKDPTTNAIQACKVGGDDFVAFCTGAPGAYGIPQDALDLHNNEGIHIEAVDDSKWNRILLSYWEPDNKALLEAVQAIPSSDGSGGPVVFPQYEAVLTPKG
jgi:hypothetical protein